MVVCVGGGWGWRAFMGVSAWCVCGLVSGGGWCGGGNAGWGEGAGMGAVLDRSLGVSQGRLGVACACRAVLAVPGWLRCRSTGGRWLPGHPGLWSVGIGWLLVDHACWHGVPLGGLLVVVGCSL